MGFLNEVKLFSENIFITLYLHYEQVSRRKLSSLQQSKQLLLSSKGRTKSNIEAIYKEYIFLAMFLGGAPTLIAGFFCSSVCNSVCPNF